MHHGAGLFVLAPPEGQGDNPVVRQHWAHEDSDGCHPSGPNTGCCTTLLGRATRQQSLIDHQGIIHSLEVGDSTAGITLTSISEGRIEVSWQGQDLTLNLGGPRPAASAKTQLTIPNRGAGFKVSGLIEGAAVDWVVDTGSTPLPSAKPLPDKLGFNPTLTPLPSGL